MVPIWYLLGILDFRVSCKSFVLNGPSRTRTCDPLIMSEEDWNFME
jgi:hypothetical protein